MGYTQFLPLLENCGLNAITIANLICVINSPRSHKKSVALLSKNEKETLFAKRK